MTKVANDIDSERIQQAHDYLLTLGKITVDFADVERAPRYPDGSRETDVEHSFHLAISATELAVYFYPHLDTGLVTQFSIVHDLPEVYSGDVWTFDITEEDLKKKKLAEKAATERLLVELPPHTARLLERYEEQVEPEARFVRFIDKLLPAVINIMADTANTFKEDYGMATIEDLHEKRVGHLAKLREMFPEFEDVHVLTALVWDASTRHLFGSLNK